jgi:hypothetical protein
MRPVDATSITIIPEAVTCDLNEVARPVARYL